MWEMLPDRAVRKASSPHWTVKQFVGVERVLSTGDTLPTVAKLASLAEAKVSTLAQ